MWDRQKRIYKICLVPIFISRELFSYASIEGVNDLVNVNKLNKNKNTITSSIGKLIMFISQTQVPTHPDNCRVSN